MPPGRSGPSWDFSPGGLQAGEYQGDTSGQCNGAGAPLDLREQGTATEDVDGAVDAAVEAGTSWSVTITPALAAARGNGPERPVSTRRKSLLCVSATVAPTGASSGVWSAIVDGPAGCSDQLAVIDSNRRNPDRPATGGLPAGRVRDRLGRVGRPGSESGLGPWVVDQTATRRGALVIVVSAVVRTGGRPRPSRRTNSTSRSRRGWLELVATGVSPVATSMTRSPGAVSVVVITETAAVMIVSASAAGSSRHSCTVAATGGPVRSRRGISAGAKRGFGTWPLGAGGGAFRSGRADIVCSGARLLAKDSPGVRDNGPDRSPAGQDFLACLSRN